MITKLPFHAKDIFVYYQKNYIIFDSSQFHIQFDGENLLKFRNCAKINCGLCSFNDKNIEKYPFASSISNDRVCTEIVN